MGLLCTLLKLARFFIGSVKCSSPCVIFPPKCPASRRTIEFPTVKSFLGRSLKNDFSINFW